MTLLLAILAGLTAWGLVSGIPGGRILLVHRFIPKKPNYGRIGFDIFNLISGCLKAGLDLEDIWNILLEEYPSFKKKNSEWVPIQERFEILFSDKKWSLARAALQMGHESGGKLGETMNRCASIYRKKMEMEKRVELLTAEGRLSAWVVGLAPFGFMIFLYIFSPDMVLPLFHSKPGWILISLAALLAGSGIFLVHKIASIKV